MALFITSLNSGSNGNCYYVGNGREAILVDAGISCRETVQRLQGLGLSMEKVRAIFISHEHSDHIRGLPVLAGRFGLPVYITSPTFARCSFSLSDGLMQPLHAFHPITIGSLQVTAFPKLHDAVDPLSFLVEDCGVKVGIFTDIGAVCGQVARFFSQCHAAFLEANYDGNMLESGRYPFHLKRRIRGGKGHLSNDQALELFCSKRSPHLQHLVLSHLSKENNCPKLVQELFTCHSNKTNIVVASRYGASPLLEASDGTTMRPARQPLQQMSLF